MRLNLDNQELHGINVLISSFRCKLVPSYGIVQYDPLDDEYGLIYEESPHNKRFFRIGISSFTSISLQNRTITLTAREVKGNKYEQAFEVSFVVDKDFIDEAKKDKVLRIRLLTEAIKKLMLKELDTYIG